MPLQMVSMLQSRLTRLVGRCLQPGEIITPREVLGWQT